MANLKTKTQLYLEANSKTWDAEKNNIVLRNDGDGDYIHTWSVDDLVKPTNEQLENYEVEGNIQESNNRIIATRKKLYGTWQNQLEEIYDDGIDSWKARITQIKTDNPKE